ncbi:hypothetical protein PI124_g15618 [Phytophthora idaei]|nr:hypothetical protein PI125_g16765 [Phytophthora idaei]KAG3141139.1 hypothetical protein PI126_g15636 [Phytophthora idaei]KAG3239439.1 hypothetical protein PI124_g15618 [Phytophthora idaei]
MFRIDFASQDPLFDRSKIACVYRGSRSLLLCFRSERHLHSERTCIMIIEQLGQEATKNSAKAKAAFKVCIPESTQQRYPHKSSAGRRECTQNAGRIDDLVGSDHWLAPSFGCM